VTEYHDVIFDEPFPHGLPRSLPSLLASEDSLHVSMDHVSSNLARSLDDSKWVFATLINSANFLASPSTRRST
jgi:hypothetical protein